MLIILGGLPGSGKTTLARALAARIGALHVRVDTIEQAIRAVGNPNRGEPDTDVGPAGYVVAYGIAEDNLTLGHTVIADSVNAIEITRNAWLAVAERAGVVTIEIEVTCSDKTEHRCRAETRATDVPGLVKPTWQQIADRNYEDWGGRALVVDTVTSGAEALAADLALYLERLRK